MPPSWSALISIGMPHSLFIAACCISSVSPIVCSVLWILLAKRHIPPKLCSSMSFFCASFSEVVFTVSPPSLHERRVIIIICSSFCSVVISDSICPTVFSLPLSAATAVIPIVENATAAALNSAASFFAFLIFFLLIGSELNSSCLTVIG